MLSIQTDPTSSGTRLDKFLCQKFDISFSLAQKIIREKKVRVNNKKVDASYKIANLDLIQIFLTLEQRHESIHHKSPQRIKISDEKIKKFWSWKVFENENLLAIDKPSGLAVQGGSGIEFCVDDIISFLNLARPPQERLQLVHRLDKDTSGLLLIAKNSESARILTEAFRNKTISKTYLAIVTGSMIKKSGVIDIPLRKKFIGKNEKVYRDESEGKTAITEFELIKNFPDKDSKALSQIRFCKEFIGTEFFGDAVYEGVHEEPKNEVTQKFEAKGRICDSASKPFAFVCLKPITGRTHQLRVHLKEIGHPIVNDIKYGGSTTIRRDLCSKLALHAYRIEIDNFFGKKIDISTPNPDRFKILNSS